MKASGVAQDYQISLGMVERTYICLDNRNKISKKGEWCEQGNNVKGI